MRLGAALIVTLLCLPGHADATYSIVAVDTRTMQVGGSGASCVRSFASIYTIYGSVPGTGAVHAQALLSARGRDRAVELMAMGETPDEIIAALTDPSFDPDYDRRQYGIVDLSPAAAGYTGARTLDYADDVRGAVDGYTYGVQGNILTSAAVIDQARTAFEAGGCDLADRLMRALEAGGQGGEGDSRCTPDGIPADGAFLQVDRAGEPRGSWLSLRVDDTAPENPLVLLRAEYDAWRAEHPCPDIAPEDAGAGGTDGGPMPLDGGFPRDSGMLSDAGVVFSRADRGGCDCGVGASRTSPCAGLLVLSAAFAARRRRRA